MTAVMETTYFRQRLRQMELYQHHDSTFVQCDCTSYSYFVLAVVLFVVGTVITVLSVGDANEYLFYSLGHMWLVGPIFICSGLMVAVKSGLYLRKKYLIQILLRQRALLRELAHQSRRHPDFITRNSSTITLPPPYESLLASPVSPPLMTNTPAPVSQQSGVESASENASSDVPPPSYDEAMYLLAGDQKLLQAILDEELKCNREELANHRGKEGACSSNSASPSKP